MTTLLDKLILFTGCILLMLYHTPQTGLLQILAVLSAIIFSCGCSCCNPDLLPMNQLPVISRYIQISFWLALTILSFANPIFSLFLPLLFYELAASFNHYFYLAACLLPFLSLRKEPWLYPWMIILLYLVAFLLSYKTKYLLKLDHDFRLLRDTSTEYHLLLQQKNKDLMEKQDYEIHVATLRERNRIAREIHDNVGHMLSRSILQSGALLAINQQENLKEPLCALKQTLSSAMDSIRNSVHDLHDDSIDLKNAILEMLSDFSGYDINLDYDMSGFVPAPVKYCFISIVKEALSNIARHSNASEISITLREHPSLYQLTIGDNGSQVQQNQSGIGILNMRERVSNLNGHLTISTEEGFRIFVSIPHTISKGDSHEYYNCR